MNDYERNICGLPELVSRSSIRKCWNEFTIISNFKDSIEGSDNNQMIAGE